MRNVYRVLRGCSLAFAAMLALSASVSTALAHNAADTAITAVPPGDDPYLAQSIVHDSTGKSLVGGTILVEAMPDSAARATWGVHPWPLAGRGSTDAAGHVLVHLQVPTNSRVLSADGVVNYEMFIVNPAGIEVPVYAFSRYYGSNADRQQEFARTAAVRSDIELSDGQMKALQTVRPAATTPTVATDCYDYTEVVSTTDSWTTVGEYHTAPWSSSGYFGYGVTADSTIGEAYSSSGTGGWTISGSTNVSNSNNSRYQMNFANQWYGYQIQGLFHYEKDAWYSTCTFGIVLQYTVEADYWDGSLRPGKYVGNWDNETSPYTIKIQPSAEFSRSAGAAYNYSGAVSVFGASLNAQSGYSTTVDEYWRAASNYDGYLYGNNNWPSRSTIIYVATSCPVGDSSCA